jgi:hypothetical protein
METEIDLNEQTRRRLILLLDEDIKHGEATEQMIDIVWSLTHYDRIVINN